MNADRAIGKLEGYNVHNRISFNPSELQTLNSIYDREYSKIDLSLLGRKVDGFSRFKQRPVTTFGSDEYTWRVGLYFDADTIAVLFPRKNDKEDGSEFSLDRSIAVHAKEKSYQTRAVKILCDLSEVIDRHRFK